MKDNEEWKFLVGEPFVQRYSGKREYVIQSGEIQVVEPREVGKTKRANEGDKST